MFNYFGSKLKLATTYQPPRFNTIVEPFAGSAQYAVFWLSERSNLEAILYDIDEVVVNSWRRLLDATPDEIMGWTMNIGDPITDYVDKANYGGGNRVANERIVKHFRDSQPRWARSRAAIGDRITVVHGSYTDAPDIEATWFIDPPYQGAGRHYKSGNRLDFDDLGEWCKTRTGQVIVCEANDADWLPFTHHKTQAPNIGNTGNRELVWYSDPEPTLFTTSGGSYRGDRR